MRFKVGDIVRIFETVTGSKFGENGIVTEIKDAENSYIVKCADGLIILSPENQTEEPQ
jgi:hypothetical protein